MAMVLPLLPLLPLLLLPPTQGVLPSPGCSSPIPSIPRPGQSHNLPILIQDPVQVLPGQDTAHSEGKTEGSDIVLHLLSYI